MADNQAEAARNDFDSVIVSSQVKVVMQTILQI